MDFYNKYLKYKNKYLQLKNQIGGYTLNLDEWKQIQNPGQQNCGIFLSDVYPTYILKCDDHFDKSKLDTVIEINKKIKLFPNIINFTKIEKNNYITMEKFDGDITNIYFNLFPKIVLQNMITKGVINEKQEQQIFDIFLSKINYFGENKKQIYISIDKLILDRLINPEINKLYIEYIRANPQIRHEISNITIGGHEYKGIYSLDIEREDDKYYRYKEQLSRILNFTGISLELYDTFINELIELWNFYHEIISKEIIKIKILLLRLGYGWWDNKLDNFGYILSTKPIDDFRKDKVPKIFDKYLYVYFLDWGSGLFESSDMQYELQKIVDEVNNGLNSYSAHGQHWFTKISSKNLLNSNQENLNLLGIDPEIVKILEKSYEFNLSRFEHSFTTIEEVEHFIYN